MYAVYSNQQMEGLTVTQKISVKRSQFDEFVSKITGGKEENIVTIERHDTADNCIRALQTVQLGLEKLEIESRPPALVIRDVVVRLGTARRNTDFWSFPVVSNAIFGVTRKEVFFWGSDETLSLFTQMMKN